MNYVCNDQNGRCNSCLTPPVMGRQRKNLRAFSSQSLGGCLPILFRNDMPRELDDADYPESDYEEPDEASSTDFRFVTLTEAVTMSQIALDLGLINKNNYRTERKRKNAVKKLYSWFYEKDITRKESGWWLH
tara:strand:+ start:1398 stop:1793 length:396 start_codon:yes stop_codon:yes gene_type:complete